MKRNRIIDAIMAEEIVLDGEILTRHQALKRLQSQGASRLAIEMRAFGALEATREDKTYWEDQTRLQECFRKQQEAQEKP